MFSQFFSFSLPSWLTRCAEGVAVSAALSAMPTWPGVRDGAQAVVHGKVDVRDLDADFYAFTGHKLYGPTAIGVLYGKAELLKGMPPLAVILGTCLLMTFLTEVTSNTATATLFIPVLGALATAVNVQPLNLMVPAAVAASYAFMLPVATPPNAIVFSSRYITIPQMARTGLWLNLLASLIITGFVMFLLPVIQ